MAHVIVAEDHAILRDGLRRILETNGHTVSAEVDDGLKVIETVARQSPDVLLLDLGLPGLHGLDIMPEVTRRTPRTRVVVLTAECRDDFVLRALRAGAAGYLWKSCTTSELLSAVNAVSRGRRYLCEHVAETVGRLIGQGRDSSESDPYEALTYREREVFHLMAEGLTNAAIGTRLFISARTVETHRANIMRRLGVKNQSEVVCFAVRRGIIRV